MSNDGLLQLLEDEGIFEKDEGERIEDRLKVLRGEYNEFRVSEGRFDLQQLQEYGQEIARLDREIRRKLEEGNFLDFVIGLVNRFKKVPEVDVMDLLGEEADVVNEADEVIGGFAKDYGRLMNGLGEYSLRLSKDVARAEDRLKEIGPLRERRLGFLQRAIVECEEKSRNGDPKRFSYQEAVIRVRESLEDLDVEGRRIMEERAHVSGILPEIREMKSRLRFAYQTFSLAKEKMGRAAEYLTEVLEPYGRIIEIGDASRELQGILGKIDRTLFAVYRSANEAMKEIDKVARYRMPFNRRRPRGLLG